MVTIQFSAESKGEQKAYAHWDGSEAEKHRKLLGKYITMAFLAYRGFSSVHSLTSTVLTSLLP